MLNILKGVKKQRVRYDTRATLSISQLYSILDSFSTILLGELYNQCMLKAAFLLMWHLALRIGEICATDKHVHNVLRYGNIQVVKNRGSVTSVRVVLSQYKHSSQPAVLLLKPQSSAYCPVKHLLKYFEIRKQGSPFVFIHESGRPLNATYMRNVLRLACAYCSFSFLISLHSFRIGKITQMAAQGTSETRMQLLGRFKSNAYKRYIRVSHVDT